MAAEFLYLIIYDIPDDKRRTLLYKRLLGYGTPVQYSSFECFLSEKEALRMINAIRATIDDGRDHVRVYRLCANCVDSVQAFGAEPPRRDDFFGHRGLREPKQKGGSLFGSRSGTYKEEAVVFRERMV